MKSFWLAWQFLTRFPAPRYTKVAEREMGHAQLWYPLVGLGLGALLYGAALLLAWPELLSASIIAALLLSLWVGMSGALHLDGLADTVDAWVGGYGDRERSLEIMKDPASGPMGVTAIVLVLLLKYALLTEVVVSRPVALILIPAMARAAVPLLFLSLPYLRQAGLGRALADHLPRLSLFVMCLGLATVAYTLMGQLGLYLMMFTLAQLGLLYFLYRRRMGGLTGDMAGAAIELLEVGLLLAALILPYGMS